MSLSPSPETPFQHRGSGKTPPPAPSAVFAKRAREIQAEEGLAGARYRPPALRAPNGHLDQNSLIHPSINANNPLPEANLPATNYPPGFRRARAGTLPSNVQLAAQNYASSLTNTPSASEIGGDSVVTSPVTPVPPPARPSLRHAASVASSVLSSERNSRLRSGSLTALPNNNLGSLLTTGGLTDAFGPSIFSSSWLSSNTNRAGFPVLEELRSVTSGDSQIGEEYDVHTLDYLGLDETPRTLPPATISELRNQTQAAIVNSLAAPSRLRANTVANPYRRAPPLPNTRLPQSFETSDDEDDYPQQQQSSYTRQRLDSYDSSMGSGINAGNNNGYVDANAYIAKGFKQREHLIGLASRSRATSVGVLDDPGRAASQRRNAAATAAEEALAYDYQQQQQSYLASIAPSPTTATSTSHGGSIMRGLHLETNIGVNVSNQSHISSPRGPASPSVRFPTSPVGQGPGHQLGIPRGDHRAVSPKDGGQQQQQQQQQQSVQTPSRSLWIGNLDSSVSGEDLAHVFAPYGAIESFRLLPEKECGFVNFVDINDAIRAKDDVLIRLNGSIGMANGQTVRIGFGKADSAPATPSSGNVGGTHSTHFLNPLSPSQGGNNNSVANGGGVIGLGGMDAQLQSSPTRALWIGSIPSTTTPATILSVFSPYGPIESARVLTHKNCGFINFERLDDAVRARKALNGRDVLGSEVGAIRIGFARVPVKGGQPNAIDGVHMDEQSNIGGVQGVGDLSVGATIHALRGVKGATSVPTDQQVLGGAVENYRSNLLLSMIAAGAHLPEQGFSSLSRTPSSTALGSVGGVGAASSSSSSVVVTEQQLIMKLLSDGGPDAEADIQALADFRPPTMYYSTIPLVAERAHNRRWDASKLRELRKRLDSGTCTVEEIDGVATDFLDGEIVDLASDWLGNTVVQKLFEKCSAGPRFAMLERIAPHLSMVGIHKNGTWAAQKVIECATTPEEVALIATNLRPYAPPLLLDQFGNYVVQCCLRFSSPANDFIFDAMADRLWEIAQGRFGARSMRACLESPFITISQQRRVATAVILNSIPLATNPNGALLLTWLLDTSGFHSRYRLLAPRFTPHLSHLCTHKLASLTVLRIVNQKAEPEASIQIVQALFFSPNDHVLTDVLGDQINGVAVVHKILQSPFLEPSQRPAYLDATKRVLIDLKVTSTQAYRRLIEEVGLPTPNFQTSAYPQSAHQGNSKKGLPPPGPHSAFGTPGMPSGYPQDPSVVSMMASLQALQFQGANQGYNNPTHSPQQSGPPQLQINPNYAQTPNNNQGPFSSSSTFSPSTDPFNPFALRSPEMQSAPSRNNGRRGGNTPTNGSPIGPNNSLPGMYNPSLAQAGNGMMGMSPPPPPFGMSPTQIHPQLYQAYMYQMFQQQQQQNPGAQNGGFHV